MQTFQVRNTGMHDAASSGTRIYIDRVDVIMSGPEVSLLPSFNQLGIVSDGQRFGGGLDHHGAALSGNLLGSGATWVGVRFLFDDVDGDKV
jgi:hypothetical protein